MGFLYNLVRSKGYKNFMSKLYGWGASLVILGALFKITHFKGANVMLFLGMCTESIIFFFSAFEPLHVEYNWALVYPELAVGDAEIEPKKDKKKLASGTPTQQLDNMLQEAKIGPELMESLASGMKNLSDTAHKLSGVSDATFATDNYVGNLTKAAESVRNLSLEYDKTAHALSRDANVSADYLNNVQKASDAVGALATIYEETTRSIKIDGSGYNDQLAKLNQNLSSINTMYEMQLQNAQTILNTSKSVEDNLKAYTDNLHASLENTIKYKEEIDKLSKNVALLSNVYGNMLSAMNVNRG